MFYLPVLWDHVAHLQLQLIAGCRRIQRRGAEWGQRGQGGGGPRGTNRLKSLFAHRFPPWLILKEREIKRGIWSTVSFRVTLSMHSPSTLCPRRARCLSVDQHDRTGVADKWNCRRFNFSPQPASWSDYWSWQSSSELCSHSSLAPGYLCPLPDLKSPHLFD